MLQSIIDAISDVATLLAQGAVGHIADHSNIKKDGVTFFLLKIVISVFVYLIVIIGIPLAVLVLIFKIALPVFFA